MDARIDDYIRENRQKDTREAIRDQLVTAGHDPAQIDEAWALLAGQHAKLPFDILEDATTDVRVTEITCY
jgi:hypothetical protein